MVQKLISRSEMARRAGVSPAAVTKVCSSLLKPACVGKRIDVNHAAAVEYLENKAREQIPPAATGLDNLYEDVVEKCQSDGNFTAARIQRDFKIGRIRTNKILAVMRTNGIAPDPNAPKPDPKPAAPVNTTPAKPILRGNAAVKERKKREAAEQELIEIPEDIQSFLDMSLRDIIEKFGTDARFVDWLSATQKIEAINEKRLKNATTKGELVSRHLVKVGVIDHFEAAHIRLMTDGAKTIARRTVAMIEAGKTVEDIETFVQEHMTSHIRPAKNKIARTMRHAAPE